MEHGSGVRGGEGVREGCCYAVCMCAVPEGVFASWVGFQGGLGCGCMHSQHATADDVGLGLGWLRGPSCRFGWFGWGGWAGCTLPAMIDGGSWTFFWPLFSILKCLCSDLLQ